MALMLAMVLAFGAAGWLDDYGDRASGLASMEPTYGWWEADDD